MSHRAAKRRDEQPNGLTLRARKVLFEDTGHMAMLERPAAFNALLEDFLARQPVDSSPR